MLVGEVVARFKAETSEYLAKIEEAKQKNKDFAKQLTATAGSAEAAMATLKVVARKNALGDFGLDKRQLSGVMAELRAEAKHTASDIAHSMREVGNQANAMGDVINDAFDAFKRGDILKAVEKTQKGLADLQGGLSTGAKGLLAVAVANKGGEILSNFSGKAKELVTQFRQGKLDTGSMYENLLQSVPVLGHYWKIGRDIREIATGEEAQAEKIRAIEEAKLALAERLYDVRRKTAELKEQVEASNSDRNTDMHTAKLKAAGLVGTAAIDEINSKANRELRQRIPAIEKQYEEELTLLRQQRDDLYHNAGGVLVADGKLVADKDQKIEDKERERDALIAQTRKSVAAEAEQARTQALKGANSAIAADAREFVTSLSKSLLNDVKSNPVAQWAKDLYERANKAGEDLTKKQAERRRNAPKLLKELSKEAADILKDRADLSSNLEARRVYDLPQVKELRGGALYAAPSKVDEAQLKQLQAMNDKLEAIKQSATEGGVTIEALTL